MIFYPVYRLEAPCFKTLLVKLYHIVCDDVNMVMFDVHLEQISIWPELLPLDC